VAATVNGDLPEVGENYRLFLSAPPAGCHMGYMSCYYRRYDPETDELETIAEKVFDPEKTYR